MLEMRKSTRIGHENTTAAIAEESVRIEESCAEIEDCIHARENLASHQERTGDDWRRTAYEEPVRDNAEASLVLLDDLATVSLVLCLRQCLNIIDLHEIRGLLSGRGSADTRQKR